MKTCFRLFMIFSMTASLCAHAQKEDLSARDPRLNEGSMFTVRLTPAERRVVVSLAGKPQAELGPDRIVVFGREILPNGQSRKLTVRPSDEGFEIVDLKDSKRSLEIEVQDRSDNKKKETFRFGPQ